jgi:hypothetical protein
LSKPTLWILQGRDVYSNTGDLDSREIDKGEAKSVTVESSDVGTEPKEEGDKSTPEPITIDDDSESEPEPELVSDFLSGVCACVRSSDLRLVPNPPHALVVATSVTIVQCQSYGDWTDGIMFRLQDYVRRWGHDGALLWTEANTHGAWQKENIKLDLANELHEFKYYIAGETGDNEEASVKSSDEPTAIMSFLAMKVDISESSSFRYPNHDIPNGHNLPEGYILVEFRSDTEFTELLQIMKGLSSLRPYFDKQARLTTKTAESYCKPFNMDSNNGRRTMSRNGIGSPTSRSEQGFLSGRKEEDILLVYPFDGDDELIEKCAKGLNEASRGGPYNPDFSSEKVVVEAMEIDNTDLEASDEGKASSGSSDKGEAEPKANI